MKILYIDSDNTIFNYKKQHYKYSQLYPDVKYVQGLPYFFDSLEPFPNAIEYIKDLMNYYNVFILTAPSYMNPLSYTGKRVSFGTHFGDEFCKRLIICNNKSLMRGDYLIDDNAFGNGQDMFNGELIHFGTEKYPNWDTTYNYLINKYHEHKFN